MILRDIWAQQWAWYERLRDREQALVIITGIIMLVLVFVWLIWAPIHRAHDKAQAEYFNELELQSELRPLRGSVADPVGGDQSQSVMSVVNVSMVKHGLTLKRFEEKDSQTLKIWVDGAQFNQLLDWLDQIKREYSVSVDNITIDRVKDSQGLVHTSMTLSR